MAAHINAAEVLLAPARTAGLGDKPAFHHPGGTLTHGALDALVGRLANGLRARGICPEQRILLLLKDGPELVAAYLAILRIGAVACALNVRATPAELRFMVADSCAALLIVDAEFLPTWRAAVEGLRAPPPLVVIGHGSNDWQALLDGQQPRTAAEPMAPDAMAFWIYTSGTTGAPKAAVHLHKAVLPAAAYMRDTLGLGADDCLFGTSKLFFAFTLGHCLFGTLALGATGVLVDVWPDSATVAAAVRRHRPTAMFSVPTMYRNLLRDGAARDPAFATIGLYVTGGERLPESLFEQWQAATGRHLRDAMGATETIYTALANPAALPRAGTSGIPTSITECELRDQEGQVVVAAEMPGVLWVRSPALADRYWNQHDRSRAAFQAGWFRTGDVYRRDAAGYWFHEGRADDMLKVSGQWVSPAEIEDAVLRLPAVADAAVVGTANADGLMRLTLFVVRGEAGLPPDLVAEGVRQGLLQRLSVYKCPRDIRVIAEIPRTATGKAQRFRLRALAEGVSA